MIKPLPPDVMLIMQRGMELHRMRRQVVGARGGGASAWDGREGRGHYGGGGPAGAWLEVGW